MVTTRTPLHRPPKSRITPEAIGLYVRIREAQGDPKAWDACHAERIALHVSLGRQIWEKTIWAVDPEAAGPPPWVIRHGSYRITDWFTARDLRRALEQAADQ